MENKSIIEKISNSRVLFKNIEDKLVDSYRERCLKLTYGLQLKDVGEALELMEWNRGHDKAYFGIVHPEGIIKNRLEVSKNKPYEIRTWGEKDLISSCGVVYHTPRGKEPKFRIIPHLFSYIDRNDVNVLDSSKDSIKTYTLTPDAYFYVLKPHSMYRNEFSLDDLDMDNLDKKEILTDILLETIFEEENKGLIKDYVSFARNRRNPDKRPKEQKKDKESIGFNFDFKDWKDYEVRFLVLDSMNEGSGNYSNFSFSTSPGGLATVSTQFPIDDEKTKEALLKTKQ